MSLWVRFRLWWHLKLVGWGLVHKTRLPPVRKTVDPRLTPLFDLAEAWAVGFCDYTAPQPDRMELLGAFGARPDYMAVLRAIYEAGGLQRAVHAGLAARSVKLNESIERKDLLTSRKALSDAIAANMTQISFATCPELAGQYIYGTSWMDGLHD